MMHKTNGMGVDCEPPLEGLLGDLCACITSKQLTYMVTPVLR